MAEKDVDEQFAAIMARWNDEALGRDPYGDPQHDPPRRRAREEAAPDPEAGPGPTNPVNPRQPGQPRRPGAAAAPRVERAGVAPAAPQPQDRAEPPPKQEHGHETATRMADDQVRGLLDDPEDDAHYSPPAPAPLPPSEDKHFWTMMAPSSAGRSCSSTCCCSTATATAGG